MDLKEEMNITTGTAGTVNLTEAAEATKELAEAKADKEKVEDISKIEVPLTESLIDEDKDTSVKKDDKVEKINGLDVKENMESGNKDYESAFAEMSKFYNL